MQNNLTVDEVVDLIMLARGAETTKGTSVNRGLAKAPVNIDEIIPLEDWRGEHHLRVYPSINGGSQFKPQKAPNKSAIKAARRDRVQLNHAKGKNYTEIAAEIGCCSTTVLNDLTAMGLRK